MVEVLRKYSRSPESPLQILQGGLERGIQLVVHTLSKYERFGLRLPSGEIIPMSSLGYETHLCNMALVNATAVWDGFKGNIVRAVRASGHSFSESQLCHHLKQTSSYERIIEPLARRHRIVHNLARADRDYRRAIPSSSFADGDSLGINLPYLKNASADIFDTAVDLVKLLVGDGLLPEEHQKTIGIFQHDPPSLEWIQF